MKETFQFRLLNILNCAHPYTPHIYTQGFLPYILFFIHMWVVVLLFEYYKKFNASLNNQTCQQVFHKQVKATLVLWPGTLLDAQLYFVPLKKNPILFFNMLGSGGGGGGIKNKYQNR